MSGMYALPLCVPINRAYRGVESGSAACVACMFACSLLRLFCEVREKFSWRQQQSYHVLPQQMEKCIFDSSKMNKRPLKWKMEIQSHTVWSYREWTSQHWGRKCNTMEISGTAAKWLLRCYFWRQKTGNSFIPTYIHKDKNLTHTLGEHISGLK